MTLLALPFPEFLEAAFDLPALERVESTIAVIDPAARLLWVNPAWHRFARENGGEESVFAGSESYLDGIAPPLKDFYRSVFANALATGEVFEQDYECSSPEKRRLFRLRVLPIEGKGLLLEHALNAEGAHEGASENDVEARYVSAAGIILQCSNCRRVRRHDSHAWEWAPGFVARPRANTSHGLCPSCVGFYWGLKLAKRS